MNNNSEIIARMTGLIYPLIIMFGFYVILNGHSSPGGGFQGGAILASVFISRYLVSPDKNLKIKSLRVAEKVLFFCIVMVPTLFLFSSEQSRIEIVHLTYLILMNLLIGLKVASGLTIIFFRFVFYEGGK
ncbi:MnhB domain-containing protein [Alkalibacter mobilis]|uniref:MnhB domain-containing protein n=1 Tax=Alkalibacter mobilis TaxID=2787712 RepID=UPI00189CD79C|nr:MnhB domain-containing protein [Alkalibacter mobilis]MBF7097077.1 MnhB domain-containing protein [Alkalibacter mobilis]